MYLDIICERVESCRKGEYPFLIHEFDHSYFVVGDHQFYRGYSLLYLKRHVRELHELDEFETAGLAQELRLATRAIEKTFSPWKMNHQCLGNQQQHIHWHILPRYQEDPSHLSMPFSEVARGEVNLADYNISAEEAKKIAESIRQNI